MSLDIDALMQAISASDPSGSNLEDDQSFMALKENAKFNPELDPPNWKLVRKGLLDLSTRTRDLRLLIEFVRTGLNIDGIEGLVESLELLRRSLESYWESIHPQLDPDDDLDPTLRINILKELVVPSSVLRFVQYAPLVNSKAFGRFSLRDIFIANGKLPVPTEADAISPELIKSAFAEVGNQTPDVLLKTLADLQACIDTANKIEIFITEKVGSSQAPSLKPLRDKLTEAVTAINEQLLANGILLEHETAQNAEAEAEQAPGFASATTAVTSNAAPSMTGAINNRLDVIRALNLICDYYQKYEPSSPIPLLAKRARRLVDMSFMEIIEDLAPDGMSQIQLIKGNDPSESNKYDSDGDN